MTPASPPISPLTYNASEEEPFADSDGRIAARDSDAIAAHNDPQSVSEELYIFALENTPKAGTANRWKEAATPKIGNGRRQTDKQTARSSSDTAKDKTTPKNKSSRKAKAKMSDSSTNGILAGQRNEQTEAVSNNFNPQFQQSKHQFPSDGSVSTMASLTSVWRRLYLRRQFGDNANHGNENKNHNRGGSKNGNKDKKDTTPQTSREEEDEASLRELEENDAFALEVGLML